MSKTEKKSRCWLTIVYPESCADGWMDKLREVGLQAIISPLHDKDVNQGETDPEQKKPHYHVMLLWDGPTTKSNAENYIKMIGGVGCIACATIRGSARYLIHLDNPEKYQYKKEDVIVFGGIEYDELIHSASDDVLTFYEIMDFIERNKITSFRMFMVYCRYNRKDWAKLVLDRYRENVFRYIRSMAHDLENGNAVGEETQIIVDSWG